jgi:ATP adenylyltransferase
MLEGMEWPTVHAPWRMSYIKGIDDTSPKPACFLCDAWQKRDDDAGRLVLHRDAHAMVIMNRYPYTTGHLMVTPGEHRGDLTELTDAQLLSMTKLTVLAERLIQAVFNPQGMNIGINIGRCAGAGLPGHVHTHLVPRWGGDTNFMTVVGQVRIIPQALEESYRHFAAALPKLL